MEQLSSHLPLLPTIVGRVSFYLTLKKALKAILTVSRVTKE
jgi:hypothetical protein